MRKHVLTIVFFVKSEGWVKIIKILPPDFEVADTEPINVTRTICLYAASITELRKKEEGKGNGIVYLLE